MAGHGKGNSVIRFLDTTGERLEYARFAQHDANLVRRMEEVLECQECRGKMRFIINYHSADPDLGVKSEGYFCPKCGYFSHSPVP